MCSKMMLLCNVDMWWYLASIRWLYYRQILLLDMPNDASLLADTAFSIFCRETLWFLEILPVGTATQLHPVLERENFVLDIGCP